jgi:hypothetical protein
MDEQKTKTKKKDITFCGECFADRPQTFAVLKLFSKSL